MLGIGLLYWLQYPGESEGECREEERAGLVCLSAHW